MLNWKKIRNSKHKLCLDINKLLYVLTLGLLKSVKRGEEREDSKKSLNKNVSIKRFIKTRNVWNKSKIGKQIANGFALLERAKNVGRKTREQSEIVELAINCRLSFHWSSCIALFWPRNVCVLDANCKINKIGDLLSSSRQQIVDTWTISTVPRLR